MRHGRAFVAAALLGVILLSSTSGPAARAAEDSSAEAMMARIEARQVPDRQGFDGLTLQQLMERMRVPGVSIAVIKDYEIHWARGYARRG